MASMRRQGRGAARTAGRVKVDVKFEVGTKVRDDAVVVKQRLDNTDYGWL